jgi:Asp-tRNA(Asn)/Glu-tRNA(Gln) amidotransferase A subunit family amidase
LTQLFNITGHPAITLPIPHQGHLPVGIQLAGVRNGTARLLAAARRVEASLV